MLPKCHGTTAFMVGNMNGLYVACDGYATVGAQRVRKVLKKIRIIQRNPCIVAAGAGQLDVAVNLVNALRDYAKNGNHTLLDFAEYAVCFLKNASLACKPEDQDRCRILLGGIEHNGPFIYEATSQGYIPSGGILVTGSGGSKVVQLSKDLNFFGMPEAELIKHCKLAMLKSAKYDFYTGGLIRIKHIDYDYNIRSVCKKSINQIREEDYFKERRRKQRRPLKKFLAQHGTNSFG